MENKYFLVCFVTLMIFNGCAYTVPVGRSGDTVDKPIKKSSIDAVLDNSTDQNDQPLKGLHWQSPSGLATCRGSTSPRPDSNEMKCK